MFRSLLSAADVTDVFAEIRDGLPFRNSSAPLSTDMSVNTARVFVARDPTAPAVAPAVESSPEKSSCSSRDEEGTDEDSSDGDSSRL